MRRTEMLRKTIAKQWARSGRILYNIYIYTLYVYIARENVESGRSFFYVRDNGRHMNYGGDPL